MGLMNDMRCSWVIYVEPFEAIPRYYIHLPDGDFSVYYDIKAHNGKYSNYCPKTGVYCAGENCGNSKMCGDKNRKFDRFNESEVFYLIYNYIEESPVKDIVKFNVPFSPEIAAIVEYVKKNVLSKRGS